MRFNRIVKLYNQMEAKKDNTEEKILEAAKEIGLFVPDIVFGGEQNGGGMSTWAHTHIRRHKPMNQWALINISR